MIALWLCALASLIEMPGVECHEEQLVLAGVNTLLWKMRVKRACA